MTNKKPASYDDLYPDRWLTYDHVPPSGFTAVVAMASIKEVYDTRKKEKTNKVAVLFSSTSPPVPSLPLILNSKTQLGSLYSIAGLPTSSPVSDLAGVHVHIAKGRANNGKPTWVISPAPDYHIGPFMVNSRVLVTGNKGTVTGRIVGQSGDYYVVLVKGKKYNVTPARVAELKPEDH